MPKFPFRIRITKRSEISSDWLIWPKTSENQSWISKISLKRVHGEALFTRCILLVGRPIHWRLRLHFTLIERRNCGLYFLDDSMFFSAETLVDFCEVCDSGFDSHCSKWYIRNTLQACLLMVLMIQQYQGHVPQNRSHHLTLTIIDQPTDNTW